MENLYPNILTVFYSRNRLISSDEPKNFLLQKIRILAFLSKFPIFFSSRSIFCSTEEKMSINPGNYKLSDKTGKLTAQGN